MGNTFLSIMAMKHVIKNETNTFDLMGKKSELKLNNYLGKMFVTDIT